MEDSHLGSFGFPALYRYCSIDLEELNLNMDVVGGVVGSLCEALRKAVHRNKAGNLLFDHETDLIKVESPYTHEQPRLTV